MHLSAFVGGAPSGSWIVIRLAPVVGEPLDPVSRLEIVTGGAARSERGGRWVLRGVTSYQRYVTRQERDALAAVEPALGRPEATRAALIPTRKSDAWWAMAQDERRAIFEERSRHIATGLRHLPAVARRLYHGRDLGEPFDFLTWFEYAPAAAASFEELVQLLRGTEEWRYVEREVDIRLERA
jgi:hypothetical protein